MEISKQQRRDCPYRHRCCFILICAAQAVFFPVLAQCVRAEAPSKTDVYHRLKMRFDKVRAIDTHDHLRAFNKIADRVDTTEGRGFNLYSIWAHSYLTRTTSITPWPADGRFETWWKSARHNFNDARATSFYRYLLPAFRDLYGVKSSSRNINI